MKMGSKFLFLCALVFVGLTSVCAAPFKIGTAEYKTLVDAVAAVPTDGTKTTIEMLEDFIGPGVQIDEGKNVVIDFGGHKYESSPEFVGAKGTETLSFRFMEGTTVYLKNGYLKASNHERSKMFIQNYSDLTIMDITIDASDNKYEDFYAVSLNHGKVYIGGNTSIFVNDKTHARAFDMCWAPKVSKGIYADGTQVVIETDGEMNGYIELDVWGEFVKDIKSTLEIKNIDFHGKWMMDDRLAGQLTIDGGKYLNPGFSLEDRPPKVPTTENPYLDIRLYLKDGNATYNDGDHFFVLPSKMVAYDNDIIFLIKGNDYKVKAPEGYENFVMTFDIEDKTILLETNGVLKGLKDGVTNVTIGLGENASGTVTKKFKAVVFDLSAVDDYVPNENESRAVTAVLNEVVAEVLEKVLDDKDTTAVDATTKANLIAAIEAGKTVTSVVDVKEVKESDLDKNTVKKIKDAVKNGEVVSFLDINLLLEADNDVLGKINTLGKKIQIAVNAPASLANVPAGTTRKFFVVRTHEGEEPEVIEAELKDGKIIFTTDKFSDYALGYTDSTNPKTGDSLIAYVSILAIAVAAIYLAKKN